MRRWSVVSGLIESDDGLLLVANRRRNGSVDWSPPGGVVDEGEHDIAALTREVAEETGLVVSAWHGPVYDIQVEFAELQWDLRVAVYRAEAWSGDLLFDDPDGIVHDAVFGDVANCVALLASAPRWVSDPVQEWLAERWSDTRRFSFAVRGSSPGSMVVDRLVP